MAVLFPVCKSTMSFRIPVFSGVVENLFSMFDRLGRSRMFDQPIWLQRSLMVVPISMLLSQLYSIYYYGERLQHQPQFWAARCVRSHKLQWLYRIAGHTSFRYNYESFDRRILKLNPSRGICSGSNQLSTTTCCHLRW